jgi:hypothetical protein
MIRIVILLYSFIILSFFSKFQEVSCWTVNCDKKGACFIQMINSSTYLYISPGYLPVNSEKNEIPIKNFTTISDDMWNVNQKQMGFSEKGILPGLKKYECAGGLNECISSCCKMGRCTDPLDICVSYNNDVRLVFLIIGFLFAILFILYWIFFYAFGVIYNSKPKIIKDNIYSRLEAPKVFLNDLEKNGTSEGPYRNISGKENNNNLNNGDKIEYPGSNEGLNGGK